MRAVIEKQAWSPCVASPRQIQNDLLFRTPELSSIIEADLSEDGGSGGKGSEAAENGSDDLIDDGDEEPLGMDTDIN